MTLAIETFSNVTGGVSFFKAVGHPLVADKARRLIAELAAAGPVAVYDPHGLADAFAELHDCSALSVAGSFVQDISRIGRPSSSSTRPATTNRSPTGSPVTPAFLVRSLSS